MFNRSIIQFAIKSSSFYDDLADDDASRCTVKRKTEASRRRDAPDVTEYARDDAHVSLFVGIHSLAPPPSQSPLLLNLSLLPIVSSTFFLLYLDLPSPLLALSPLSKAHRIEYQQVVSEKIMQLTKVMKLNIVS